MNKHRDRSRYFKPGDMIIYTALLSIFVLGTVIAANAGQGASTVAVITLDGHEVHRVDLNKVEEPYEFRVASDSDKARYNLVRVEKGQVRVIEASCPDQIDVKQGWISRSHQSIICLPNRLVIRILPNPGRIDEIDGIVY